MPCTVFPPTDTTRVSIGAFLPHLRFENQSSLENFCWRIDTYADDVLDYQTVSEQKMCDTNVRSKMALREPSSKNAMLLTAFKLYL